MKKNVILQNCGFSTAILKDEDKTLDVKLQMLHTGLFFDMNATEVVVDKETIENICNAYNESAEMCYMIDKETDFSLANVKLEEFDNRNAPNQVNHDATDAFGTVGHVIGLMDVKERNGKTYLMGTVRIKGAENVARVRDKRWRNVSIQFNPETYEFVEVSWVVKGAAYEARKLSATSSKENNSMSGNFKSMIDTIHRNQKNIIAMKNELEATKHLIALSKIGTLNRAQINKIKPELSKFNDPKAVIKLMESVLPNKDFKPKFVNNQPLMKELLKGTMMTIKTTDATTTATNIFEAVAEAAGKSVALGDGMSGIEHSNIGEDDILGYDAVADKHMELMRLAEQGYESGDMEMGRKFSGLAKKLAEEMKAGKAKLSDYEIAGLAEDCNDVKELAKKIKTAEEDVKKDVDSKLAALEEKFTVMLAANSVPQAEIKEVSEAIVLLTKIVGGNK